MTLTAQAKVLRVLQTGEFTRVGGEKSMRTDCRVVAATNRDLEAMVKEGSFREDLYFRLNVVPIRSPDLKERPDDVPLLVESFVRECCDENGLGYKPVDDGVLDRLKQYDWPGNVRELRNVVERLVIMSDEVIREKDLPPYLGGPRPASKQNSWSGNGDRPRALRGQEPARVPRGGGVGVHPHPPRRVRVEHLADGAGARDRANEPAQEAPSPRHPSRRVVG